MPAAHPARPLCAYDPARPRAGDVVRLHTNDRPFVVVEEFAAYRVRSCDGYSATEFTVQAFEIKPDAPPALAAAPLDDFAQGAAAAPADKPALEWVDSPSGLGGKSRCGLYGVKTVSGRWIGQRFLSPTHSVCEESSRSLGWDAFETMAEAKAWCERRHAELVTPQPPADPNQLHWLDGDGCISRSRCGAYAIDFTGHYAAPYRATKSAAGGSSVIGHFASANAAKDACQENKTYPF
jgi:hypothetical protein